jgi:negative regulator of flagellin synthesis FlgM
VSGKISGVNSNPPASPATGAAGPRAASATAATTGATGAPGGASGTGSATDSVQITDTASYLVTAEQTLADVPVINSGRVAETSDALANGTYKISPERIANQLLQFERLLPEDTVA